MVDRTDARDLIIVGAGPAGMAAAIEAAERGLGVTVLDENGAPGGRIWQALEARSAKDAEEPRGTKDAEEPRGTKDAEEPRGTKDADDAIGLDMIRRFRTSGADIRHRATVWSIEPDGSVFWSEAGVAHRLRAAQILLATGTTERPLPIPGWTLPGVMTVGAAQIALKTGGLVPEGSVWLAGQGPLLLLYAVQVLRAGGGLSGILDLGRGGSRRHAWGHVPRALAAWRELAKGFAWRREIHRARVPWLHAADLQAQGIEALTHVSFSVRGRQRRVKADLLLLHDGVIPSVQLSRAVGCAHEWHAPQQSWRPITDAWGRSSVPHVLIAGDGAGVGGALAAAVSGRIAALSASAALGRIDAAACSAAAAPLFAQRARHLAIRPLLDALHAPMPSRLAGNTLVCRCEEVSAADIRNAVERGCLGLNQLKAYTRCGMGPCQGRMCGPTAAAVMAEARGVPVPEIEPFRPRFPTKPVTVGELAALVDDP